MLVLSRKSKQAIRINGNTEVTVLEIKGGQVKLGITAPREVHIVRAELPDRENVFRLFDGRRFGSGAILQVDSERIVCSGKPGSITESTLPPGKYELVVDAANSRVLAVQNGKTREISSQHYDRAKIFGALEFKFKTSKNKCECDHTDSFCPVHNGNGSEM